ncbi:MAG: copper resistance protein CopC [Dehalococcoidia bacterium]|nr:copper resistance protein CopC [Dehalococcoidia bacterium]
MRQVFRVVLIALLVIVGMFVGQGSAVAHAELLRSDPTSNVVLRNSPSFVQLWFSEAVEARASQIKVYDNDRKRVDKLRVEATGDRKSIKVDLEQIGPGRYTVEWVILSALDGHPTAGRLAFSVGTATAGAAPSPAEGLASASATDASSQVAGTLPSPQDVLTRWASLLASALLFGGFALVLISRRPSAQWASGDLEPSLARFMLSTRSTMTIALVVLAAASSAALLIQASSLGDLSASGVLVLLGGTRYGSLWLARVVLIAGLAASIYQWKRNNTGFSLWTGLVTASILLLNFSLSSHAAALEEGPLPVLTDWLHLLAAAAWMGGLVHLARALLPVARALKKKEEGSLGAVVLAPFSKLAILCVSTLVLTGLYGAWLEVRPLSSVLATPYGWTLLVKLGLSLPALLLGFVNFRKVSRLSGDPRLAGDLPGSRALRSEALFGMAVFLAVAVLVAVPPGRGPSNVFPGSDILGLAIVVVLLLLATTGVALWWRGALNAALERSLSVADIAKDRNASRHVKMPREGDARMLAGQLLPEAKGNARNTKKDKRK